jgi:1-aminocyclopropane-1-carboxylate deaminase/D-cysteine desulfhydrase-like pyridoxal-dependent ACC family enzyme
MIHFKTILDNSVNISSFLNINLFIKRDDLYPISGGGSKARKINFIINENIRKNYNAIVTVGSNQSNHLRTTALWAAKLNWKLICIIHDDEPDIFEGNLKIVKLTGAELRFIKKTEVKEAMDLAMVDLSNEGFKPFYIWGGGHCLEGALAYYEAVKELKEQLINVQPDFIFVASGTGTTQAGIEVGVRQFFPECKVIGISVAREKQRGKKAILESMNMLNNYLGNPIIMSDDVEFDDNWMGNGYESIYPELIETIKWAAKIEGLILDPTYTGKAFHALKMYVKKNVIKPNSNVVFWHTGGLLNLMATNQV